MNFWEYLNANKDIVAFALFMLAMIAMLWISKTDD